MCMSIFIAGPVLPRNSVIKSQVYLKCALQISNFLCNQDVHARMTRCKASLTSHRTCTYVLVTEKNRRICKGHLSQTCDFITDFLGCRPLAMKIDMHIILCVLAASLQMHPYLKGNLRETSSSLIFK